MNKMVALGLFSLLGACVFSCGDDDDPVGSAGSAGAAGNAGNAGTGGGGMAGDGMGGNGGNTMAGAPCTGCVEITLPFSETGQQATFAISYAAPGVDFSNAVITWSVKIPTADDGAYIKPQLQNGAANYPGYYDAVQQATSAANFPASDWVDIVLDASAIGASGVSDAGVAGETDAAVADAAVADAAVADAAVADAAAADPGSTRTEFDKAFVEALQLQLGTTTGTAPLTVLVDSVTITGVTGVTGSNFDSAVDGFALNEFANAASIPAGVTVVHHP